MFTSLSCDFPWRTGGWWAAMLPQVPGGLPVALGGVITVPWLMCQKCTCGRSHLPIASVEAGAPILQTASVADGLTVVRSSVQTVGNSSRVSSLARSSEISSACCGSPGGLDESPNGSVDCD